MITTTLPIPLLLLILSHSLFAQSSTERFDIHGFRLWMKFDDAAALARDRGWEIHGRGSVRIPTDRTDTATTLVQAPAGERLPIELLSMRHYRTEGIDRVASIIALSPPFDISDTAVVTTWIAHATKQLREKFGAENNVHPFDYRSIVPTFSPDEPEAEAVMSLQDVFGWRQSDAYFAVGVESTVERGKPPVYRVFLCTSEW